MVLKRIPTSEVRLGMYVHAFDGGWFSHPFWRARFVIRNSRQLSAIRDSKLDTLVIDTEQGADSGDMPVDMLADLSAPTSRNGVIQRVRAAHSAPLRRAPPPRIAGRASSGLVPVAREFGNARIVMGKAQKVVSKVFLEARLGKAPRIAEVAPIVEDIFASIQRNPYAFSGLMRCKADAESAYRHALSVSAMMVSLARHMKLSPQACREAGLAGLLLDIGVSQLALDLEGLKGKFETIAPDLLHRHVYVGHDTLEAAGEIPEAVLQCVLRHHERIDGSGFPQGLKGPDVDQLSRMAAICDTYDHLVAGAYAGEEPDPADAMQQLMGMSGALDPEILPRFLEVMGVYPIGAFVRLRSDRLAMVVDEDPASPGLPVVRTFFSLATMRHVGAETLALAHCFGADEITGIADFAGTGLPPPHKLRETLLAAVVRER